MKFSSAAPGLPQHNTATGGKKIASRYNTMFSPFDFSSRFLHLPQVGLVLVLALVRTGIPTVYVSLFNYIRPIHPTDSFALRYHLLRKVLSVLLSVDCHVLSERYAC
jgi:hypothetical protein